MTEKDFISKLPPPSQELHRMIQEINQHCAENGMSIVVGSLIDEKDEEGSCWFVSKNAEKSNGSPLLLLHIAIQVIATGDPDLTVTAMDFLNQLLHRQKTTPAGTRIQ